jgi:hypothetical protein
VHGSPPLCITHWARLIMSPQLMAQYVVRVMHASTCSTQCLCSHGRFCCVLSCRDDAHVVDSGGVITNLSEALQVNMRELDEWGANVRTWIATHIKEDLVRRSLVPFKEYHDDLLACLRCHRHCFSLFVCSCGPPCFHLSMLPCSCLDGMPTSRSCLDPSTA